MGFGPSRGDDLPRLMMTGQNSKARQSRKDNTMETKKRITMDELWHIMHDFNVQHPDKEDEACLKGVIVYKASNWPDASYTETERSYEVYNCNRQFQPGKIANSLYGYCKDGKDLGVRLDWYRWNVEYCYMEEMECTT